MEKPADPEAALGICLSINQAADEFGHDRRTIKKRIDELGIRPALERQGYPVFRLRDLLQMERTTPAGEQDPDKMSPFERQAHYKAEAERLKVDQARGALLPREEYETELSRILKLLALELSTLTDEIERDVGPSAAVLEKIEAKVDEMRQRLHDRIVEDPPAEQQVEPEEVEDDAAGAIR